MLSETVLYYKMLWKTCDCITNKHMVIQVMKTSSDLMAPSREIVFSSRFNFPNVSLCICTALQCLYSIWNIKGSDSRGNCAMAKLLYLTLV